MNFRQGDVIILGLKKLKQKPDMRKLGFKPKGDNVIIEGEITGHLHTCDNGKLYEKGDKLVIEANEGCILKHPEHNPIRLPKGYYEIKIQEEYDDSKPEMKSKVKD